MRNNITYEYIKEYIEQYGYKLLSSEYVKAKSKIEMMCDKGHMYFTTWDGFRAGRRCPECAKSKLGNYNRKTLEEVKINIESVDGYKLLSTSYKNGCTKLELQCPKGHIFQMTWNNFMRGERCGYCSSRKKKTYEEVKSYIESFEGYILISKEYKNSWTKLEIQCPKRHIFNMNWGNFTSGYRCADCNLSKGEEKIKNILLKQNIKFKQQYSFNDLISDIGYPLKFDFGCFVNDKLFLVEYDGVFHYEKQYAEDKFERTQLHDKLKNNYCNTNNISLLRIPYWEFDNVEEILLKHIKHE
jgi:hypothetical protein